jgi:hypothetical protein
MAQKKKIPSGAITQHTFFHRVPIKNTEAVHSFIISFIYFEDAGPVCNWSDCSANFTRAIEVLKLLQRDSNATVESKRNHYHRDKSTLVKNAVQWIDDRPALKQLKDYLWAFRSDGTHRIWGILSDGVFYVLWNDPEHKICPVEKK